MVESEVSWAGELEAGLAAAPVSAFLHAPLSPGWQVLHPGMVVEVLHSVSSSSAWLATVLRMAGYQALLRYAGLGDDPSLDFWLPLCGRRVRPAGWSAGQRGGRLDPPAGLPAAVRSQDRQDVLRTALTGALTLPHNFYQVLESDLAGLLRVGLRVELVDRCNLAQVRVGRVRANTAGRLLVEYEDKPGDLFVCNEESELVHPVGWASSTGHRLAASKEYKTRVGRKQLREDDSTSLMFRPGSQPCSLSGGNRMFEEGQQLEARDPLNLSTFCRATVRRVLNQGFIMVSIDCYPAKTAWVCFHASSPYILPLGSCSAHQVPVRSARPRARRDGGEVVNRPAPAKLFTCHRTNFSHQFQVGMKLECVDLMNPEFIYKATVRFDGFSAEWDQWMDCSSPDLYPLGWTELAGLSLTPPPATQDQERQGRPGKRMPPSCDAGMEDSEMPRPKKGLQLI